MTPIFLTEANLLHYLLERRFADLESVVKGEFSVRNRSRRNRNFQAICGERQYFVKQPGKWEPARRESLDREAAMYWRCRTEPAFEPLRALLPEAYGYDPENSILTLRYLPGQTSLRESADRFAPEAARLAGATMGALHHDMRAAAATISFPRRKPWYLSIGDMPENQRKTAPEEGGRLELMRALRKHAGFARALEPVREEWRHETMVHGDWKLDNCLLSADGSQLQVIDWEFADHGDPFEDIGTMLQSWWNHWIRQPLEYGIDEIRPALVAFLEGYAEADGRDPVEMRPRAVRFAAARMAHTAYEALEEAREMTADAACLLQASLNMLTRPEWAVREIFGAN